jgi:hypothetical protein
VMMLLNNIWVRRASRYGNMNNDIKLAGFLPASFVVTGIGRKEFLYSICIELAYLPDKGIKAVASI